MRKNTILLLPIIKFIVFACIILTSTNTLSQDLKFGISGAAGTSQVALLQQSRHDSHWEPSFHVGCFMELPVSKKISFGLEVNWVKLNGKYTGRGFKLDYMQEIIRTSIVAEYDFVYVSVPLSFRVNFNKFNIGIGGRVMFEQSSRFKSRSSYTLNGELGTDVFVLDELNYIQRDFGPTMSFGYWVTKSIMLDLNGYYGLTDLAKDLRRYANPIKHRQIMAGIKFVLARHSSTAKKAL